MFVKTVLLFALISLLGSCTPKLQRTNNKKTTKITTTKYTPEFRIDNIAGTNVNFKMALIPAGQYKMGSPETEANRDADESPEVEVKLDAFWMSIHEMTFDEYNIFREKELDKVPEGKEGQWNPDAITRPSPPYEDPSFGMGNEGFPATSMTQFAALQYCKWLSDKTGVFYRLPTEAEWEYACRANTRTAYYFGDEEALLDDYAWHYGNSGERYHKVGLKKPNAWGLYDMHGNVSEWTLDQYDDNFYTQLTIAATEINKPWAIPVALHPRSVKGGSWDDPAKELRSANRIESSLKWKERDPQIPKSFWWNTDSPFVGFRLISPKNPPSPEEQKKFWELVLGG